MTSKVNTCNTLTPFVKFNFFGLLFVTLILANALPASAAAVTGQLGMMNALGQPVDAINAAPSPDVFLVRRGDGNGRKSGRGGSGRNGDRGERGGRREYGGRGGGQRDYRGGRGDRRDYGGRGDRRDYHDDGKNRRAYRGGKRKYGGSRSRNYFYYGLPFYGYAPYYNYYGYRPNNGRCAYWSRRCAANWGYGNRNYYGCMRYYGCR